MKTVATIVSSKISDSHLLLLLGGLLPPLGLLDLLLPLLAPPLYIFT